MTNRGNWIKGHDGRKYLNEVMKKCEICGKLNGNHKPEDVIQCKNAKTGPVYGGKWNNK